MPDLATDRLLLRRFTEADAPFLLDLHSRPEVQRWLGSGEVQADPAQAAARAARYAALEHPVRGIWAIADRDGGALLGTLLLKGLPASTAPLAGDDPAPRDAPAEASPRSAGTCTRTPGVAASRRRPRGVCSTTPPRAGCAACSR
jgi:hypothetical protein